MGFVSYLFLLVLAVVAAYAIIKTHFRQYSTLELILKLKQLSPHARAVMRADILGNVPATWLKVSDMRKMQYNLGIQSILADRFLRVIPLCEDECDVSEMRLTHTTFLRKRAAVRKFQLTVIAYRCFGKIASGRCCVHMAALARNFTDASLMAMEMAEVMGCPSALEGQFLHGT